MKTISIKLTAAATCFILLFALCGMNFIKWVECNVSSNVLNKIYDYCASCYNTDKQFEFSDAIAYIATRNGNRFTKGDDKYFKEMVKNNENGQPFKDYADNKYFKYNKDAYGAIFKGFVGEYVVEGSLDKKFGMTAYFPFANGYWYNHYDDFGASRSFGFKRKHLGHDIMGGIGTPVVAIEGGTVAECGWNRYGGWRIGIVSDDGLRYYYYAHLKKDKPFAAGMEKGVKVRAGEVVGFLGQTGYSDKENVNLKSGAPHLHFGMQLIFDLSQIDCDSEIWIDVYAITKFLERNRVKTQKLPDGEYRSVNLRLPVKSRV